MNPTAAMEIPITCGLDRPVDAEEALVDVLAAAAEDDVVFESRDEADKDAVDESELVVKVVVRGRVEVVRVELDCVVAGGLSTVCVASTAFFCPEQMPNTACCSSSFKLADEQSLIWRQTRPSSPRLNP